MVIIGKNRVPETPPAVLRLPTENFSSSRDEGILLMLIFEAQQCHK